MRKNAKMQKCKNCKKCKKFVNCKRIFFKQIKSSHEMNNATGFCSYVPPVAPQPNGDYAYDFSYKSPNRPTDQLYGAVGSKPVELSVHDLLAPRPQPTMPPIPTTPTPPAKRCIPDEYPEAKGLCSTRENRRSLCAGTVSSISGDCNDNELCCYKIAGNVTRKAKPAAVKTCQSPISPAIRGTCALRGEREKKCQGMMASPGVADCAENEVRILRGLLWIILLLFFPKICLKVLLYGGRKPCKKPSHVRRMFSGCSSLVAVALWTACKIK